MLKEKKNKNYPCLSGIVDYRLSFPHKKKGVMNILIDMVHSLSDKGCYFDWKMQYSGYGSFSMHKNSEGGWLIDNENKNFQSCLKLIQVLEEGLLKLNDEKVNYVLEKLKYNISPECKSLTQGLEMIWDKAEKDDYRDNSIKDKYDRFSESVFIDELRVDSLTYYCDKYVDNMKNVDKHSTWKIIFDYQWEQFGALLISKWENSKGEINYFLSEGIKKEALIKIINKLETQNKHQSLTENDKNLDNFNFVIKSWQSFKKDCQLEGSVEEIVDVIMNTNTVLMEKHICY